MATEPKTNDIERSFQDIPDDKITEAEQTAFLKPFGLRGNPPFMLSWPTLRAAICATFSRTTRKSASMTGLYPNRTSRRSFSIPSTS